MLRQMEAAYDAEAAPGAAPVAGLRQDAVPEFPAPGRYDLVLLANGEDLAHHALEVTHGP